MSTIGSSETELYPIRTFKAADLGACKALYREGLIGGRIAENDTALDIDDIASTYLKSPGSHFWVATTTGGEVVGMIGAAHHEKGTAEIRRLRVNQEHRRRGIGARLVQTALQFCTDKGYLKVTLDTYLEEAPAIKLFERFRFKLSRDKEIYGKKLLYFYLDLYDQGPRKVTKKEQPGA